MKRSTPLFRRKKANRGQRGAGEPENALASDAAGDTAAGETAAEETAAAVEDVIDETAEDETVNTVGETTADTADDATKETADDTAEETPADAAEETPDDAAEESRPVSLKSQPADAGEFVLGELSDTPLAREIADLSRRRAALAQETLPLPEKTRIFTIANQKGGVGKTTTTVNIAAALARAGARVLVIDLDPQGNASTALGLEHHSEVPSVYDVLIDEEPIGDVIQPSPEFDGLFCVPATIHLAGAEIELVSLVAREQRLRSSLSSFLDGDSGRFHYVFIDCPPSLGLLTINAFVAATEVLIPIQCEYYALEGLSQLLNNITLIEKHLNPLLRVSTILLTMFDSRTNLANQVAQDVRDHFPDQVLATPIPRSVRISEAPSYGQTVISYDKNSAGAVSYREAAAEIARRGAPN